MAVFGVCDSSLASLLNSADLVEIIMGDLHSPRRGDYFFCIVLAISGRSAVPSRLFVFKQ